MEIRWSEREYAIPNVKAVQVESTCSIQSDWLDSKKPSRNQSLNLDKVIAGLVFILCHDLRYHHATIVFKCDRITTGLRMVIDIITDCKQIR